MSYLSPRPPLGEADAALLRALFERYPDGTNFDEINIAIDAVRRPELMAALNFLGPTIDRRRHALCRRAEEAVAAWIEHVEDRPAGGLVLTRDRVGWCYVGEEVPR